MRGTAAGTWIGTALLWASGVGVAPGLEAPASVRGGGTTAMAPAAARLLPPAQWQREQLLRAAVDRYPQLLERNASSSMAVVGLALRPDGSIAVGELGFAGSGPAVVTPAAPASLVLSGNDLLAASRQSSLEQALVGKLRDTGGTPVQREHWGTGASTPQGRPLALDLNLYFTRVPANFDAARSATRVRDIVRRHHTDLLYTGSNTRNRLTVLLDEESGLLNRQVDRVEWTYAAPVPAGAAGLMAQARELARRLQIDVAQVGLIGDTVVREGGEWYHVAYAWRRRPGETGPTTLQAVPAVAQLDLAAVESIVRQHFGAAAAGAGVASGAGPAQQTPAIVLSAGGAVLRTGYVPMHHGGLTRQALEAPLLVGTQVQDVLLQPLGQGLGAGPAVLLVWEAEPSATATAPAQVPVRGSR